MSLGGTCAVVVAHSPDQRQAVEAITQTIVRIENEQVFDTITVIAESCEDGPAENAHARANGVARALVSDAQWILHLECDECLHPSAFKLLAPALAPYDAMWGAIEVQDAQGTPQIPKASRFSCQDRVNALHMALNWWVGRSHMVSAEIARRYSIPKCASVDWYARYLLNLWSNVRCLKMAHPLTTTTVLPKLSMAERQYLLDELEKAPEWIPVSHGGRNFRLPFTGRNPTLERQQLRGLFYEINELEALRSHVPTGATIIDVGANTGNHTVFFAGVMLAKRVIPIEGNPQTCDVLRQTIAANKLDAVDCSKLGIVAGRMQTKANLVTGTRGHLGTARFNENTLGKLPVLPLDALVDEAVNLIKIDVEGRELDVLNGARRIIHQYRPIIFIEVRDENVSYFLRLVAELDYSVIEIFPDEDYSNYVLASSER